MHKGFSFVVGVVHADFFDRVYFAVPADPQGGVFACSGVEIE